MKYSKNIARPKLVYCFKILTIFVFPLLICSCVIIPLPDEPPFPQESLAKLSSENANKSLVRSLFGKPKVLKNDGEYWFYADNREVAGILGGSSGAVIEDSEWLAIQFDELNKVKFYEFNDDRHGCLSNGICHLKSLFSEYPSNVVITATKTDDDFAKNYQVKESECAIYFYQNPIFHVRAGNYPVSLTVDNAKIGAINYETYLFLTHPPGKTQIKAYQFEIMINCTAGEKFYIQAEEGWTVKEGEDLAPVSASIGKLEIKNRRLALPD